LAGKVIVVVFALIAGVGAAAGYAFVMESLEAPEQDKHEQQIAQLKSQLETVQAEVQMLSKEQREKTTDTEVMGARVEAVEKQVSKLREDAGIQAAEQERRLSGSEIVSALRELRAEDKKAIRDTMAPKEPRTAEKREDSPLVQKAKVEQELSEAIAKLSDNLSLTLAQQQEMREIGKEFVEKLMEAAQEAQERQDPSYVQVVRKQLEKWVVKEIVETVLTAEQLDKWRDINDDIEKLYPRDP
jgi:hypothetical protein